MDPVVDGRTRSRGSVSLQKRESASTTRHGSLLGVGRQSATLMTVEEQQHLISYAQHQESSAKAEAAEILSEQVHTHTHTQIVIETVLQFYSVTDRSAL